ncbi:MAG: hypothetical protein HKN94_03370 [Acidimicrobiales bacterium]|nr:hypothetical protein [Acidimicrobiales bacterium]RZV44942.1 MAG: hypothetical protein EX269_10945 [Acidimicrobiales bacterium]
MTAALLQTRRGQRGLVALVVAGVVVYRYILWHLYMRYIPLTGDEKYYHRGASILARWWRGVAESETALERIVAKGWFMPGPIGHIVPLRRMTDNLELMRLWQGALDLILLAIVAVIIAKLFGRWIALGWFTFVGLMPDTAAASFSLWGEAHGSKVLMIALLGLTAVVRRPTFGGREIAASALLGGCVAWAIYLRPPFLLEIGTLVVAMLLLTLGRRDRGRWVWPVVGAALVPLVAVAMILPWSKQVSDASGGFVFTTNTINVNFIHAFTDPSDLEAFTGGGVDFPDIERALRARMDRTGESYVEVLANVRSELMADVSIGDYLSDADREIGTYLDEDETFLRRYDLILTTDPEVSAKVRGESKYSWLLFVDNLFWYPLAWVVVLAMVRPLPLGVTQGFLPIIAKIAVPAAMIQPWLSNAKFRHLGAILPFLVLVALVYVWGRRDLSEQNNDEYEPWAAKFGWFVQAVAAVMTVATVAVYLF